MATQPFVDLLPPYYDAAASAKNNFTSITDIGMGVNPSIPAVKNKGQRWRFTAWGLLSTTGTPNITLSICYGTTATVLAATAATATGSGVSNVPWRIELNTVFYTIGSSGTAASQGFWWLGTSVSAWTSLPVPATALATVTVDNTTAKDAIIAATWSAASASNTITCWDFMAERLN